MPGGKAVYPSSVLMNVVPAHVAGVKEIIMVTPPGRDGKVNPNTLVAAKEAGAEKGRPGNSGSGFRHRVNPEGRQDRGTGEYLRGSGEKSSVRQCEYRLHRGTERDPRAGR